MKRHHITLGALTTVGGTVVSASARGEIDGQPIAVEGDKISCPCCKSVGQILCIGPRIPEVWDDKPVALEGDYCICRCSPPPRLLPRQALRFQEVEGDGHGFGGAGAGGNGATVAGRGSESTLQYDEQVRAVDHKTGDPISDLAYYIEAPDGSTYSGYTNAEGLCERVATARPEELTVWFGEDAEKKMQEA